MSNKKILDVTCGSRTIWFNKNHPNAIYCDKRDEALTGIWKSTNGLSERTCYVHPDIQCDFTCLPFDDNSFSLVVFDPPHLIRAGDNSWMVKKYGKLGTLTCHNRKSPCNRRNVTSDDYCSYADRKDDNAT